MTKLWLDDVRPAPEGWIWAQSYDEAISLWNDEISDASLDNDLALIWVESDGITRGKFIDAPSGRDFLKWIIKNDKWPSESLAVHSANVVEKKNICLDIEQYGPYSYREQILYPDVFGKDHPGIRYS